jgi:pimeloyl-ACP methyl ester carboxylesterase
MPQATINNANLWYEVTGEGSPLLLHHGYTASRVNWQPVCDRLKDKYQIIMMECRGTGESEHTEDGYNLTQYSQATAWAAASHTRLPLNIPPALTI